VTVAGSSFSKGESGDGDANKDGLTDDVGRIADQAGLTPDHECLRRADHYDGNGNLLPLTDARTDLLPSSLDRRGREL
jgi:hypothetical protein